MEIVTLGSSEGLPPVDWDVVVDRLGARAAPDPEAHNAHTTWLSTLNVDGSVHMTAVGAMWIDGTYWFQTGAKTVKARNVARDPRSSIGVAIRDADVVLEG